MKPFLVPASLNPKPTVVSLSKRNTSLIFPEKGIRIFILTSYKIQYRCRC